MKTAPLALSLILIGALAGCGGTGAGNPINGNVLIQSHALAGPSAASVSPGSLWRMFEKLFGITSAWAAVSSFQTFQACNDTLTFKDVNGNTIPINGNANPTVGQGLLTFSNSSTGPMTIGFITIPPGTQIKEVDITFAVVPTVCTGANYAVLFDNGVNGQKLITQNTAFKFPFSSPHTIQDSDTLTLLLGAIVNGMVSLGASLDNSTIQTVNVGQAQ